LIDLVKTMTGLKDEVIRYTDMNEVMTQIVSRLQWLSIPPSFLKITHPDPDDPDKLIEPPIPPPDHVYINKKKYMVPKDLEAKTFGQKISLQIHLKMNQKDGMSVVEAIPFALAIYFQPLIESPDGIKCREYDEDRARDLIPLILEMNLLDAYVVGSFFLGNSMRSLRKRSLKSRINQTANRLLRRFRNFNLLASSGPSTDSRKETCSSMTKSFYNRIGMYL